MENHKRTRTPKSGWWLSMLPRYSISPQSVHVWPCKLSMSCGEVDGEHGLSRGWLMAWAPGAYFTNHQRKQVSCNKIRRGFQNPSIFCRHLSGDRGVLFYQLCEPFLPVSSRSICSNKMWLGQTRLHPYEPISAPLIPPPQEEKPKLVLMKDLAWQLFLMLSIQPQFSWLSVKFFWYFTVLYFYNIKIPNCSGHYIGERFHVRKLKHWRWNPSAAHCAWAPGEGGAKSKTIFKQ